MNLNNNKKRGDRAKRRSFDSSARFERLLNGVSGIQYYSLRLYVTGTTTRSAQAIASIRALCEEFLGKKYDLEVVDIYQQPTKAVDEQIIAAPTLIKRQPHPRRRLVGNLSDREKLILGLNLKVK